VVCSITILFEFEGGKRESLANLERCLGSSAETCRIFECGCETLGALRDHLKFFKALGRRVKELRQRREHSQEDMISFGFSARHWQQIEAGRPITVTTLLRICGVFKVRVEEVVRGLDRGIYHD